MNTGDYILARALAEIRAKQFEDRAAAGLRVYREHSAARGWLSRQGRRLLSRTGALLVALGLRLQASRTQAAAPYLERQAGIGAG